MPITQDRLHAVTLAARSFYDALNDIRREAITTYAHLEAGTLSPRDAANDLYASIIRWQGNPQHYFTLATEEKHYALTHKRNARTAQAMRNRRSSNATASKPATIAEFDIEDDPEVLAPDDLGTSATNGIDYDDLARKASAELDKERTK